MTEPTDVEIADVARKAGLLPDNSHPAPETRATRRQTDAVQAFARAIEAEVRKQDEALIRQMLESMCWAARVMTISEDEAPGYFAAISAARARLEQPCA